MISYQKINDEMKSRNEKSQSQWQYFMSKPKFYWVNLNVEISYRTKRLLLH